MFMSLVITFLGNTPISFGVALVADSTYPAALAWPAVLLGLVAVVDGVVARWRDPQGASPRVHRELGTFTLWVLLLGVALGRRAAAGGD
jgi:hypothetical protein